jgi:cytochrome c556
MKSMLIAGAVTLSLGAAIAAEAYAQEKPENYVRYRKATQVVTAWHMRELGAMAKGAVPYDQGAATRAASTIATLAPMFAKSFHAGTNGHDTRARPEVWSQADRYKTAMDRYVAEATKMVDAAKAGNVDTLRTQFGALSKTCSSCHDDFRMK